VQDYLVSQGRTPAWAHQCHKALIELIEQAGKDVPASQRILPGPEAATLRELNTKLGDDDLARRYVSALELRRALLMPSDRASTQSLPSGHQWEPDALFTGREHELEQIAAALRIGEPDLVSPVVLHGLTGCGKTSLALEFAARESHAIHPVFIPATNRATLVSTLEKLTNSSTPETALHDPNLADLRGPVTARLPGNAATLLILDGVTEAGTVQGLIARKNLCRVIITTNETLIDEGFTHIEVGGWSQEESEAYIRQILTTEPNENVEALANGLFRHPLGIAQATKYCRSLGISADGYLNRFKNAPLPMLDNGQVSGYKSTCAQAISLNIAAAAERDGRSALILLSLAFTGDTPLPEDLFELDCGLVYLDSYPTLPRKKKSIWSQLLRFNRSSKEDSIQLPSFTTGASLRAQAALRDPIRRDRALRALQEFSLVKRHHGILSVHPLIRLVAREIISPSAIGFEIILGPLSQFLSPFDAALNEQIHRYIDHVTSMTQHALDLGHHGLSTVAACLYLARYLGPHGDDENAVRYATAALDIAKRRTAEVQAYSRLDTSMYCAAASAYAHAGEIDYAIELLRLGISSSQEKQDKHELSVCLHHLGQLAVASGRREVAVEVLHSLEVDLEENRRATPAGLTVAHTKTQLLRMIGRIDEARELNQWCLDQLDGDTDTYQTQREYIYSDAAVLALDSYDSEVQLANSRQIMEIRRRKRGGEPSPDDERFIYAFIDLADSIVSYATDVGGQHVSSTRQHDDLYAEAESVLNEAEEILDSRYGKSHHLYPGILSIRGRLHFIRGNYAEARTALTEAEAGLRITNTQIQKQLVPTLFHLAQVHYIFGDTNRSFTLMREVCQRDLAVYGEGHPEVVKNNELLEQLQQAEFFKGLSDMLQQALDLSPNREPLSGVDVFSSLPPSGATYIAYSSTDISYIGRLIAQADANLAANAAQTWSSTLLGDINDEALSWEELKEDSFTVWRMFDVRLARHFYVHRYDDAWRLIEALSHGGHEAISVEALEKWGRATLGRKRILSPRWKPGPTVRGNRALTATLVPRHEETGPERQT
jgi:tetratricopeptide (TPR) repeat protein